MSIVTNIVQKMLVLVVVLFFSVALGSEIGKAMDKEYEFHCRTTAKNVEACLAYGR